MRRTGDALETLYRTHIVAGFEVTFDEFLASRDVDYLQIARRWSHLSPHGELRIGSYDDPPCAPISSARSSTGSRRS